VCKLPNWQVCSDVMCEAQVFSSALIIYSSATDAEEIQWLAAGRADNGVRNTNGNSTTDLSTIKQNSIKDHNRIVTI